MAYNLWQTINNIKNAQKAKKAFLINNKSNIAISLLNILWQEGFILGYSITSSNKLKIYLKYKDLNYGFYKIQTISKPSKRLFLSSIKLWKLNNKKGILVFSTCKGLYTLEECKKLRLGGELLFFFN